MLFFTDAFDANKMAALAERDLYVVHLAKLFPKGILQILILFT